MPVETVSLFLGFLAMGGVLALVGLVVVPLFSDHPTVASTVNDLRANAVRLALVVAATAMAGSLYYSEIAGYDPCRLCWIQRGFMYPLVPMLVLALRWSWLKLVALPLAVVGLGVALYHRAEQQFPDSIGGSCDIANPCSGRWVDTFGFITIPTMAAVAFALVSVLLALSLSSQPDRARILPSPRFEEVA